VMGMITYDKQEILDRHSRSFSNGFQPDRGLSPDTTGTQFATQTGAAGTAMGATFRTPTTGTQTFNRANLLSFQNNCESFPNQTQYQSVLWGNLGFRFGCAYDYGGAEVLIQPVERTQFLGRGAMQLSNGLDWSPDARTLRLNPNPTTQIEDPQFLSNVRLVAPVFKKEPNGSKWDPTPCSARW